MTLQEAKNEVAKKYGYTDWWSINFYAIDKGNNTTSPPYSDESLRDEAAELYASSLRSELAEKEKEIEIEVLKNTRLLEEKAKLIERVDNAEKRVNFWLTHWNKLDMEFTEFKSSITSPQ